MQLRVETSTVFVYFPFTTHFTVKLFLIRFARSRGSRFERTGSASGQSFSRNIVPPKRVVENYEDSMERNFDVSFSIGRTFCLSRCFPGISREQFDRSGCVYFPSSLVFPFARHFTVGNELSERYQESRINRLNYKEKAPLRSKINRDITARIANDIARLS